MKKPLLLLLIPTFLLLVGCSTNKGSVTPSGEETPSQEEEEEQGFDVTFTFKGASDREGLTPGSLLEHEKTTSAIKSILGEYIDSDDPSCFSATSCSMQDVGGNTSGITSVTVGTAKKAGTLEFNFKYDILKVEYTFQNYFNEYPGGTSIDSNALLYIEDKKVDLSVGSGVTTPEEVIGTYKYPNKKKSLNFHNTSDHQRTYIHELKITFSEE